MKNKNELCFQMEEVKISFKGINYGTQFQYHKQGLGWTEWSDQFEHYFMYRELKLVY